MRQRATRGGDGNCVRPARESTPGYFHGRRTRTHHRCRRERRLRPCRIGARAELHCSGKAPAGGDRDGVVGSFAAFRGGTAWRSRNRKVRGNSVNGLGYSRSRTPGEVGIAVVCCGYSVVAGR